MPAGVGAGLGAGAGGEVDLPGLLGRSEGLGVSRGSGPDFGLP